MTIYVTAGAFKVTDRKKGGGNVTFNHNPK